MYQTEQFAVVLEKPPESNEMLREFLHTIGIRLSTKPKGELFPLSIHPEVMAEKSLQNVLMPYFEDAYIVDGTPY